MTNKQIIIDGVDIFREIDEWADTISQEWNCDEYSTAKIIKSYILDINEQLARLNTQYNAVVEQNKNLQGELNRKTQECEEYKKTHKYNNAEFKQERDSLIQEIIYNNRYKQILEEIKEIAEVSNMPPCLGVYDCSECANCRDALTSYGELCMQYGLYKILQKCEEISSESKET